MCRRLCVLLMCLCGTGSLAGSPGTPLKIGVASWVGWSFIHVAVEQKFFEDAGLKVEAKWYAEPEQINQAFAKGEIQFRLDFVASVADAFGRGEDVVFLGETNWSNGGDKIIAKKGKEFASSKGATIGLYRDSPALLYFLSVYLESLRLNVSDFKLKVMPLDSLVKEFSSGQLNFVVIFDPYTIDLVKQFQGAVKAYSSQFPGCMPEGIYTHKATWQAMPEAERVAMMKACVRAAEWMQDDKNWPRLVQIINTKVFPDHDPFEDAEIKTMMSFVKIHPAKVLLFRNKPNGGLEDYLANLRKFLIRNGRMAREVDPKAMLDTQALVSALQ